MALKITEFDKQTGRYKWLVPFKGIQNTLAVQDIPPDALFDARNVVLESNNLVPRPGFLQFTSAPISGRPTGIFGSSFFAEGAFQEDAFQNDAFQISSNVPPTLLIVGGTTKIFVLATPTSWIDITGTTLTALSHQLARFTGIQLGTPPSLVVVHANGVDPLRKWSTAQTTFTDVQGSPPIFSDITTIDNRIVGIVPPFEVRWSPVLDVDTWPSANSRNLSDTRDRLVAISNFGLNGGVVYKDQSIWNIVITGSGDESSALRLDFKREVEGPASAAALVNAGPHYYMTRQGRVGRWDFFNHAWVADGVWELIKAELDPAYVNRIHGAPHPSKEMITFYYPRIGDGGDPRGRLDLLIPNPQKGRAGYTAFLGSLSFPVTASGDSRLDTNKHYAAGIRSTGGEKITNGTFPTNLTGWTDIDTVNGVSQWSSFNGGSMELNQFDFSSIAGRTQSITTVVGNAYTLTFTILTEPCTVKVGNSSGGGTIITQGYLPGTYSVTFIATATTTWISFIATTVAFGDIAYVVVHPFVDNVSVVDSTAKVFYAAFDTNDDGVEFSGYFQTGLPEVPKTQPARLGSMEVFAERGASYGTLTFKAVTSNLLDKEGGTVEASGVAVDLSDAAKAFDLKGADVRGRFIGARFEFTTPITLRYKGAVATIIDRDK